MPNLTHEVRDGLYGFIEFDDLEKRKGVRKKKREKEKVSGRVRTLFQGTKF